MCQVQPCRHTGLCVLKCWHGTMGTTCQKGHMMQRSLGGHLQVLRAQRGLTLTEASELLGMNRHTLSRLEQGTQKPYGPTLKKLAEGYGVPVEELLEEP